MAGIGIDIDAGATGVAEGTVSSPTTTGDNIFNIGGNPNLTRNKWTVPIIVFGAVTIIFLYFKRKK